MGAGETASEIMLAGRMPGIVIVFVVYSARFEPKFAHSLCRK